MLVNIQDKPITEVFDFWSHTFEIINSSLTKLIKIRIHPHYLSQFRTN